MGKLETKNTDVYQGVSRFDVAIDYSFDEQTTVGLFGLKDNKSFELLRTYIPPRASREVYLISQMKVWFKDIKISSVIIPKEHSRLIKMCEAFNLPVKVIGESIEDFECATDKIRSSYMIALELKQLFESDFVNDFEQATNV